MKLLYLTPFLLCLNTSAQAISAEKCKEEGKKCFCVSAVGAGVICVETKKSREAIKGAMLSTL